MSLHTDCTTCAFLRGAAANRRPFWITPYTKHFLVPQISDHRKHMGIQLGIFMVHMQMMHKVNKHADCPYGVIKCFLPICGLAASWALSPKKSFRNKSYYRKTSGKNSIWECQTWNPDTKDSKAGSHLTSCCIVYYFSDKILKPVFTTEDFVCVKCIKIYQLWYEGIALQWGSVLKNRHECEQAHDLAG